VKPEKREKKPKANWAEKGEIRRELRRLSPSGNSRNREKAAVRLEKIFFSREGKQLTFWKHR